MLLDIDSCGDLDSTLMSSILFDLDLFLSAFSRDYVLCSMSESLSEFITFRPPTSYSELNHIFRLARHTHLCLSKSEELNNGTIMLLIVIHLIQPKGTSICCATSLHQVLFLTLRISFTPCTFQFLAPHPVGESLFSTKL